MSLRCGNDGSRWAALDAAVCAKLSASKLRPMASTTPAPTLPPPPPVFGAAAATAAGVATLLPPLALAGRGRNGSVKKSLISCGTNDTETKKNSGLSQRTVKACTEIVTMNSTVFYCYKPNNCPNQIWKTLNSVQGTQVVVASRHHWFSIRQGRRPCRASGSEMGCSMSYIATNPTIALIRYGKR